MPWEAWVIIGWFALNALLSIAWIGRPRPTTTPAAAVVAVLVYVPLICCAVRLAAG